MSYDVLRRELKQGVVRGLYLFYGPEEYLKRYYAGEIEKLVADPIAKDVSRIVFEDNADPGAVYDACAAYPLFGGKRLVVLKNCGLFKPGQSGAKRGRAKRETKPVERQSGDATPASLPFATIIEALPEFTCLLIIEDEADKRLSLFKQISEKGLIVEFSYRSPNELEDWVKAIAGRDGKMFARDALKHFVAFSTGSMTELRSELDKLLMYTQAKSGITLEDVNAVCDLSLKVKIFGLLDSILAGKKRQANDELDALLREREPAMRIIASISNHLVLLRQIKGLADAGVKLTEATKLMGLNPYRTEILWRQSARLASGAVERAIEQCCYCDMAIKNGYESDLAALRMLVMSIDVKNPAAM